jgi:homospermidine synthase
MLLPHGTKGMVINLSVDVNFVDVMEVLHGVAIPYVDNVVVDCSKDSAMTVS